MLLLQTARQKKLNKFSSKETCVCMSPLYFEKTRMFMKIYNVFQKFFSKPIANFLKMMYYIYKVCMMRTRIIFH